MKDRPRGPIFPNCSKDTCTDSAKTCHALFGTCGESAVCNAIGSFFVKYLKDNMNIEFTETDPWERFCRIIGVFTSYGFYSHAEMKKLDDGTYWMTEAGQYAGNVWSCQNAWERGAAPSPLWSVVLYSLSEIGNTMAVDEVRHDPSTDGNTIVFHFEPISTPMQNPVENARETIQNTLVPICASCKRIRTHNGAWEHADVYFKGRHNTTFSHTYCPDCAEIASEEMRDAGPVESTSTVKESPKMCCTVEEGDWMYTI